MRLSNIDSFVTQKMSWNLINKFPHSTMHWAGLDGSTVWAHFPPMDNYCSDVKVKEMLFGVSNFKERGVSNVSLCLFGYGDGGGGPTYDMLERLDRYVKDIDGIPRTKLSTAQDYFNALKSEQKESKLETWHGELYFELHRGCYTSQASTKRGNRKGEIMLHDVEILGALTGQHYDITALWKLLLLNQFHDVLPGSSIGLAYKDALEYYEQIQLEGEQLRNDALDKLAHESTGTDKGVLVANTLSWDRTEIVEVDPTAYAVQVSRNGKDLVIVKVPSLGFVKNGIVPFDNTTKVHTSEDSSTITLENDYVRVRVSKKDGTLSLYDKRVDRDVIVQGGNQFVLYDDIPLFWDAWDVEVYHLDKPLALFDDQVTLKIVEEGPLRATISLERRLTATSKVQQFISLNAISARVDFETTVDWLQERHVMLKVQFPTTVYNPQQQATFESQFGHLQRPTHRNTSWDWSKFEVHCQKWFDLSEYDYGLSILNDCKYGCSVLNSSMSISLLRSPKAPDEHCDMGTHKFTYSLFPHLKSYQEGRVIQEAHQLNAPLLCRSINAGAGSTSLLSLNTPNVIIEAVKKAEDDTDMVVRLYEAYGGRSGNVVLHVDAARRGHISSVKRVNILEEEIDDVVFEGSDIHLGEFKSFQIQTIKINFK
jgi:alpha-mannosidase